METIGVRELRQNASKYLRRVAAGESITVTDRGKPVAVLVPTQRAGISLYEQMVASGELIPAENPDTSIWFEPPLESDTDASAELQRQREDRM